MGKHGAPAPYPIWKEMDGGNVLLFVLFQFYGDGWAFPLQDRFCQRAAARDGQLYLDFVLALLALQHFSKKFGGQHGVVPSY